MIAAPRAILLFSAVALVGSGCSTGEPSTVIPSQVATGLPAAKDVVFLSSNAWSNPPAATSELFAVGGTTTPTRLTYCTTCQVLGASPSLDRTRVGLRRVSADTNGDGKLTELDRSTLLLLDLSRQIEGPFLPDGWSTSSVDWSSDGSLLVHTSSPDGGTDDIYKMDPNGQNNGLLLGSPGIRERGARINPEVTRVVYERIEGTGPGKSEIWIFTSSNIQTKITDGGPVGPALAGTYYLVGSDAGPAYSPDGASLVFRRLTSNSVTGGTWDILVVSTAGGAPTVVASGPQFRSSPDWNKDGIVFSETNATTGATDVIAVTPTTGARRVLQSFASGVRVESTRWISGTTN